MGHQITLDYAGKEPLFVGVLRGATVFLADLIRQVDLKLSLDFISVSSYGAATVSTGQVQMVKDLETTVRGLDVILVEDIVDTGLTLNYLLKNLRSRQPASLATCALLSKPSRRQVQVAVDYLGFEVPDRFVVGYGLDYGQKYRNLPYVAFLNQEST